MAFDAFGCSEQAARERNEDAFAVDAEAGVFVVADGLGGRPGGAEASRTAVASFLRRVQALGEGRRDHEALRRLVRAVDGDVRARAESEPQLLGLGSTLSAWVAAPGGGCLVHLGDSRAYRFRGGTLTQLTRDHTVAGELLALARLTPEVAAAHPLRRTLSRFLGSAADAQADVDDLALEPGDWLLLCTDGLTNVVPEPALADVLSTEGGAGAERLCRRLLEAGLARGPADNLTAVAVQAGA